MATSSPNSTAAAACRVLRAGSAGQHRDEPLCCPSVVMVLEGEKKFAVLTDKLKKLLPENISPGMWREPISINGTTYSDFEVRPGGAGGGGLM